MLINDKKIAQSLVWQVKSRPNLNNLDLYWIFNANYNNFIKLICIKY